MHGGGQDIALVALLRAVFRKFYMNYGKTVFQGVMAPTEVCLVWFSVCAAMGGATTRTAALGPLGRAAEDKS